jgi:hypothetical protein
MDRQPGFRRINGIVSAVLVVFFLVHAALGSMSLLPPTPRSIDLLIWAGCGLLVLHVVLSTLTSWQMLTDKQRPPSKRKKEHLVLKWLSGVVFLVLVCLHIGGSVLGLTLGNGLIYPVTALLLVGALALHTSVGVKSLTRDLDLNRRLRNPVRLVVCAVSLVIALAILLKILA